VLKNEIRGCAAIYSFEAEPRMIMIRL